MLRLATTIALASLSLAVIQPMGVAGAKVDANSSSPGPAMQAHAQDESGPSLAYGAAGLGRRDQGCSAGQYRYQGQCTPCSAGYYCTGGNAKPVACPAGTWTDQLYSSSKDSCKNIQCGYRPSGGNYDGSASIAQIPCGVGSYSAEKSTTCTLCPKGNYCNSLTTCTPTLCDPGTYASRTGSGLQCDNCPAGTFNNSYGNTSCCKCCAGWYNIGVVNHTTCQQCPNLDITQSTSVTSSPGTNDPLMCQIYTGAPGQYAPAPTCSQDRPTTKIPGTCPAETGMMPTMYLTRRTVTQCTQGKTRCEVKSGRGGWECVDTQNSLETCGGCDNDCSLLDGTNEVGCVKGHCVVNSCASGYALSQRGDGISRGGLEVGQHCVALKKTKRQAHVRHSMAL